MPPASCALSDCRFSGASRRALWESLGFVSRFCRFRLGTLNGEETGIGVEEFDDGEKGKAEESKRRNASLRR